MASGGLPKVKQTMLDFVDAVRTQTQQLVTQLQQLPDPAVANGSTAKAAMINAFTKMTDAFATMENQIKAASTTDATAFQNAIDRKSVV